MRRGILILVALVSLPSAAWAQVGPLGPEFRVNTYTTDTQYSPAVASDAAGNFIVVWTSLGQDGSSYGVFGQRYASSGTPLGAEFRVNAYTTGAQGYPSVAADPSGNFVVVWQSLGQDGSAYGIFGQRYASSGAPQGPEFRVNTYTTSYQRGPSVAADSSGNFVVVWQSLGQDGSAYGIFGQRYSSAGAPQGPEFRVNTYTANEQASSSIASDPSGSFVVVWGSALQDGSSGGAFGQRYASSGATLGPEFRVNTYTTNVQERPAVASDAAGNFFVAWTSSTEDGSGGGTFGQRYASSGAPQGPEFRVNTYTTNGQGAASVAADSSGNVVVVWRSMDQDGSSRGVFGQRYASSGTPLGSEFRVNTYTTGDQYAPAVASDASGNFVVVWASAPQDGSGLGVFGQRYGVALSVGDVTVTEGDAGAVNAVFTVSLSIAVGHTVSVQYVTADGTAIAGADYTAVSGTLTFPPGTVSQAVSVPVLGDVSDEDDETFTVNLSNPTGASIADGQGLGTITDDDPLPALFAGDCASREGGAGSVPCDFTVTLVPVSGRTVTVAYATADGTATAGTDYLAASGSVTFPPGVTQQLVSVSVLGDAAIEGDESFSLNLSSPTNATLGDAQGAGTILDDDAGSLSMLEVSHGTDLSTDLSGGAADLYRISQPPYTSHEVVLDAVSGDAVPGLLLERLASDNSTVLQTAGPVGTGSALSLRWENLFSATVNNEHIRVRSPACGSGCGADDVYRLRVYDTSLVAARFNNAGSQITVLVVQNRSAQALSGHVQFWSASGTLLASPSFSLSPQAVLVLNTAGLPALQGKGGSLTLSHDGAYGAVAGKTVALEPATGFSFDSPLELRLR